MTELTWMVFLFKEMEWEKKGGDGEDQLLGRRAAEEKREAEREGWGGKETGREWGREGERGKEGGRLAEGR